MQVKDFIGADLLAHLYSTTEQVSCYISTGTLVVVYSTFVLVKHVWWHMILNG